MIQCSFPECCLLNQSFDQSLKGIQVYCRRQRKKGTQIGDGGLGISHHPLNFNSLTWLSTWEVWDHEMKMVLYSLFFLLWPNPGKRGREEGVSWLIVWSLSQRGRYGGRLLDSTTPSSSQAGTFHFLEFCPAWKELSYSRDTVPLFDCQTIETMDPKKM